MVGVFNALPVAAVVKDRAFLVHAEGPREGGQIPHATYGVPRGLLHERRYV